MTTEGSLTESALVDKVKEFLTQFKDSTGSFSYVEQIDQMIVKQSAYIIVDFNDLVSVPVIESKFIESADEIFTCVFKGYLSNVEGKRTRICRKDQT